MATPAGADLSAAAENALADAARAWPALELLMVFGSAARGRLNEGSDVDLFVRLAHGSPLHRSERERFLAAASRACGREIDLVIEQPSTSVILRREIAEKGRPLFERSAGSARTFVVDAIRAYVDLEPQLRKIGTAIRARARDAGVSARDRLLRREPRDGR